MKGNDFLDFTPSKYQQAILDYFLNEKGNMLINALAGTGKSSTICMLTEHATTSDVYLAFNSSIAAEFKTKIKNPKTKVYTLHALAYSIMNYNIQNDNKNTKEDTATTTKGFGKTRTAEPTSATLDNLKPYKIIEPLIDQQCGKYSDWNYRTWLKNNYVSLYNLTRSTMTSVNDSEAITELIDTHGIFNSPEEDYMKPDIYSIVSNLSLLNSRSIEQFESNKTIDFADMLYITYHKLKDKKWEVPYYHLYTNVYLDEAQDNSKLQLSFLPFIKRKNGRIIVVMDKNQAIYMFNGGDAKAFAIIPKMFAPMKQFDLPVCYRCPVSHLQRVNQKFNIPILPRDGAPTGFIKTIQKSDISVYAKAGDLVISRKNKWLSPVVLDLARHGIPVYIEDSDFVKNIHQIIKASKCSSVRTLDSHLINKKKKYEEKVAKMKQKIAEKGVNADKEVAEEIDLSNSRMDNIEFLITLVKSYPNPTADIGRFDTYIDKILNTTPSPACVRISSVHKAKGLEAQNVFVLNEGKVCFDNRNSPEQNQQEKNLSYISITRAKEGLYLVVEPPDGSTPKVLLPTANEIKKNFKGAQARQWMVDNL